MINMKGRMGARVIACSLRGRRKKVVSVEETTDGGKREDDILRGPFAMMQANGTSTTMEARDARVPVTSKSTPNFIGRKYSSG